MLARAAPPHRQARAREHGDAPGRDAAAGDADQAGRRQEHHRGRRVHRLLSARHGAGPPRRRQGNRHRREPRVLRARPAAHREGRRRAQGGLPGGPRAGAARRAPRRRGQRGGLRLRVRGRRQAQLREVPRAAAPPGARRRRRRVRQHAVGGDGGAAARRAAVRPRPERLDRHTGPQRQALRRRACRCLPAHHRRRRHRLPPPRVMNGRLRRPRAARCSFNKILGLANRGRQVLAVVVVLPELLE